MIIGFSRHGKGGGSGVVGYIADGAEAVGYVAGETKAGKRREIAPVVIRGDPEMARHLIDLVPHRWKYTSGMISFSTGERVTPEMERRVMDDFERSAFAGLDRDRFYTLWVRHRDGAGGCHHLHLVTPRMDLLTGKSLNIAPPGKASRQLFDTLRSKLNAEWGLSDPDDPNRIQAVRLPRHLAKAKARARNDQPKEDARVLITRHLEEKARAGVLKGRDDVARYLRESGFVATREGDAYLTVENVETGERLRLRGGLYDRTECQRVIASIRNGKGQDERSNPERLSALEANLEQLVAVRAEHNRKRYGPSIDSAHAKEASHDRIGERTVGRGSRSGAFVCRARGQTERALGRFNAGARRLEQGARNLVRSRFEFSRALECARARQRDRQLNDRLIAQFGSPTSGRPISMERGLDREMEREFL